MGTSLENMDFVYLRIWKSQNFRKSCVPNLNIFLNLPFFPFLIFWFKNMIIWWNDEKSKTRNFLRFISPAEFLQKLGYEFHFDQKTWNTISQKRTNFSIKFMRNTGSEGPLRVQKIGNFKSSQNHPKSIGIWPGTLISHFGIIKTPNWL